MKNIFKISTLIFCFSSISIVLAEEKFDYYIASSCKVEKSASVKIIPEEFNFSNNLVSEVGSNLKAEGKVFILTGKLLDANCLPISDAKINIWQADSYGVMNDNQSSKNKTEKFFQNTGTANSDNLGLFHFQTLLPNYFNHKDGLIYLKVVIENIGEFYKIININESMLRKNDLYLINAKYRKEIYQLVPQYKFIWSVDVNNNFIRY